MFVLRLIRSLRSLRTLGEVRGGVKTKARLMFGLRRVGKEKRLACECEPCDGVKYGIRTHDLRNHNPTL